MRRGAALLLVTIMFRITVMLGVADAWRLRCLYVVQM